jgi:glycosyltransferase involved in cell wall biosynthesis
MNVLAPATDRVQGTELGDHRANNWDGLVVICASTGWDQVRLADRHMTEHLAPHAPVLYVEPPISHLTRIKHPELANSLARPRLRRVSPRIARYTPVVPPKPMHPAVVPLTSRIVRRQLRDVVRRLGGSVHAVVSTWLFVDTYGVCGERRRVYWWRDDPVGAAELWHRSGRRLARGADRLAGASDLVVAVNADAARRWETRGFPAAFLPNGCDATLHGKVDEAPDLTGVKLPRPIAGFLGHLNGRTDLGLLEAVADAGVSLLIVGPKDDAFEPERFDRLASRHNVAYVGARPFEDLPPYLKAIDVGLVPYTDTTFNRGSFPLKTLEYLAAGRPVVATPLPAVRWLATDLVDTAATPAEFAAAVLRNAPVAREPRLVRRRREFASRHSWARRAEEFASLLDLPASSIEARSG